MNNWLIWVIALVVIFNSIAILNPGILDEVKVQSKGVIEKVKQSTGNTFDIDIDSEKEEYIKYKHTCKDVASLALWTTVTVDDAIKGSCLEVCGEQGKRYDDYRCSEDGGFLLCKCR